MNNKVYRMVFRKKEKSEMIWLLYNCKKKNNFNIKRFLVFSVFYFFILFID